MPHKLYFVAAQELTDQGAFVDDEDDWYLPRILMDSHHFARTILCAIIDALDYVACSGPRISESLFSHSVTAFNVLTKCQSIFDICFDILGNDLTLFESKYDI